MNVSDVAVRVKRSFGDDAGIQITDEDIFRWINDAQLEISIQNEELLEGMGTADIVEGQADYPLPSNVNKLRSLMYDDFRLKNLSFNDFNEYLDGFKAPATQNGFGNGTPQVFMLYAGNVTLFPKPDRDITGGLKIYFSSHPMEVSNLADNLSVPERYHNSIVDFCLRRAYEMDENPDMTAFKKGEFETVVQKLKDQEKTTSEYYPRITTLPEDENYGSWGGWIG